MPPGVIRIDRDDRARASVNQGAPAHADMGITASSRKAKRQSRPRGLTIPAASLWVRCTSRRHPQPVTA